MPPMNVLFITADQLRGDCLGCCGHPLLKTPHLDALAADGVRFAKHFTTATPCAPARASIHTGMYLSNHRVISNGTALEAGASNWALEIAEGSSVQPALIGYTDVPSDPRTLSDMDSPQLKHWDGGHLPGFRNLLAGTEVGTAAWLEKNSVDLGPVMEKIKAEGFASWNGWAGSPDWMEVAKGMGAREDAPPLPDGHPAPAAYPKEASDTYVLTSKAVDFITQEADAGRRWALHLSLLKPHVPFLAPEPYNKRYHPRDVGKAVQPLDAKGEADSHPFLAAVHAKGTQRPLVQQDTGTIGDITNQEYGLMKSSYYGLISEVDDNIGRLIEGLKKAGEYDKTLIVFTADHGEMMGDHWLRGKLGFYDGAYHIPLIVRDPRPEAGPARGSSIAAFTEHVDIAPTILDYFGLLVLRQCDGLSLRPFLQAAASAPPPPGWREAVHFEHDFRFDVGKVLSEKHGLRAEDCALAVLRTPTRKLVHFGGDLPSLLFDLSADPSESRDVSGHADYAADLAGLQRQMLSWRLRNCGRALTHLRVGIGRPLTRYDSSTFDSEAASLEDMRPAAPDRAAKRQRTEGGDEHPCAAA